LTARSLRALQLLIAILFGPAATAEPRDFAIDPVHSRVLFMVDHAGFSSALATLSGPRGWIRIERGSWDGASVEVEVDLARLDLGDENWNTRVAKRDFFNTRRYPKTRFVSREVIVIDAEHARVIGELQLRDSRLPLTLNVRRLRDARHPLTLRRTVGFSATAKLSRAAFGITAWKSLVGDDVELRIEVEAQRKKRRKNLTNL
jgi:polyisoprenoid-binding protein YceI